MRKVKEKRKQKGNLPFSEGYFEFISPLTFEECVSRLHDTTEHGVDFLVNDGSLSLNILSLGVDTCEFQIRKIQFANVKLIARLERYEERNTFVVGATEVSRAALAFLMLPHLLWIVLIAVTKLYVLFLVLVILIFLQWGFSVLNPRYNLVYIVRDLLNVENV